MLTKTQRISKKMLAASKTPYRFIKTPFFSAKVRNNEQGLYRFAFVISKKIAMQAVVRNSLKRRMSAALTQLPKPKTGYDIIVFPKKDTIPLSVSELQVVIQEAFQKNHII